MTRDKYFRRHSLVDNNIFFTHHPAATMVMMKLRNSPVLKTSCSLLAAAISILAADSNVGVSAFSPQLRAVTCDNFPPMLPQTVIEQKSKVNKIHLDSKRALPSSRSDFEPKTAFPKSVQTLQREGDSELQALKQSDSFEYKGGKWVVLGFISLTAFYFIGAIRTACVYVAVFAAFADLVSPLSDAIKNWGNISTKNLIEEIGFTRLLLIVGATAVDAYFDKGPGVVLSKLQTRLLVWVCGLFLAWSATRNTSTPEIRNNGFKSYDGSFPITAEQS